MVIIRRRLIFWLIKAYIKKSGKTLIFFFFLGLIIFFSLIFGSRYVSKFFHKKPVIGLVGSYTQDNLPPVVVDRLSQGLTKVESDGSINPAIAERFEITDSGKTYTFYLKSNLKFNDKTAVTTEQISYNFSDVTIEKPEKSKLVFKLKDAYSPFLTTVSKPVFKKGFRGTGEYNLQNVDLNGNFIQSMTVSHKDNRFDTLNFQFYPTEDSLKMAFTLGEITQAQGLTSTEFKNTSFKDFPGSKIEKQTNYSKLVTLFYNTTDDSLADKKMRLALSYALPDDLEYGEIAHSMYPPNNIYYNSDIIERTTDYEHAGVLVSSPDTVYVVKVLRKYRKTADKIVKSWEKIGIKTKIEEVDVIPDDFQIFLGEFNLPKDPDQYVLWHTGQPNNITRYKNLRIDKLLEDGRKTVNIEERKKIYDDFQKFLLDDTPADFLYFPYEYTISRS